VITKGQKDKEADGSWPPAEKRPTGAGLQTTTPTPAGGRSFALPTLRGHPTAHSPPTHLTWVSICWEARWWHDDRTEPFSYQARSCRPARFGWAIMAESDFMSPRKVIQTPSQNTTHLVISEYKISEKLKSIQDPHPCNLLSHYLFQVNRIRKK